MARFRASLAVMALLLSAGCGERETSAPAPAPATADLKIEVRPEGKGGPVNVGRLRCPGDARCERLERAGPALLASTPPDVACTQIFGGPQTAEVRGVAFGRRVDVEFSRADGCEIARWDRASWLLGKAP